jgi:hypothetical protein
LKADDLEDMVADISRWDFNDEGLLVRFAPYEVASYAEGPIGVTIAWTALHDFMSEQGYRFTY